MAMPLQWPLAALSSGHRGLGYALALALTLLALVDTANASFDWAMLHSYPRHYVSPKLGVGQKIQIDGKLDEPEWAEVPWSTNFVDITHHQDPSLNGVPEDFQTSVKMRWDSNFLYIGAELKDPFVYGDITGHNQNSNVPPKEVPYHNNDFEVFIDVSGTTEYYKEFEMNVLNATYDVNWGVPDQTADICNSINPGNPDYLKRPWLPVCTNTTDTAYPGGNWTMWSGQPHVSGLRTATSYNAGTFGKYVHPHQTWSLEIAFPINSGPAVGAAAAHGGLLSQANGADMAEFDPNLGDAALGMPRFWHIDFARAEHPRVYDCSASGGPAEILCPLNCSAALAGCEVSLKNPDAAQCLRASKDFPTMLGTDIFYGCYWEWVWQGLGIQNYMHRPTQWGVLQFADSVSAKECRDIMHPVRHIAQQLHLTLAQMKKLDGSYTTNVADLITPTYCNATANGCDLPGLALARTLRGLYTMSITVTSDAPTLSRECTARPCYSAAVELIVPCDGCAQPWKVTASINENQYLRANAVPGAGPAPCLPAEGMTFMDESWHSFMLSQLL